MILHDKCGPFELKIIELEAVLKDKEKIINELKSRIDYLEQGIRPQQVIKEDEDGKSN